MIQVLLLRGYACCTVSRLSPLNTDQMAGMRRTVKELLKYDNTEGFEKQRTFLQGLYKLIKDGQRQAS